MRRIILILAVLLVCLSGFSQRGWTVDSIRVPNGADTTVYYYFWTEEDWGIQFDYRDFDDVDAVLNLGACPVTDGTWFDQLDNASLPYTLADSTVSFEKAAYNFRYLAIKLTKNTVTAGLYMKYYITRDDKPTLVAMKPGRIEYQIDGKMLALR